MLFDSTHNPLRAGREVSTTNMRFVLQTHHRDAMYKASTLDASKYSVSAAFGKASRTILIERTKCDNIT